MIEITVFQKANGPLTKRIELANGKPQSDGSACLMGTGTARRFRFDRLEEFADLIANLGSDEALALGRLRLDLPNAVKVVTKRRLAEHPGAIARTTDYLIYCEAAPAVCLIDFDRKGMPPEVAARIDEIGGPWCALISVLPELASAPRLRRASTSAGLFNVETGEKYLGSGGEHIYVMVRNGADVERFLTVLHRRCWLAGFGWMMVGAGGQLLERSIVDRMVFGPERLVFEGPPTLDPPLGQDTEPRKPEVRYG